MSPESGPPGPPDGADGLLFASYWRQQRSREVIQPFSKQFRKGNSAHFALKGGRGAFWCFSLRLSHPFSDVS